MEAPQTIPIRLVCATRESQSDFYSKSALGRSLTAYPWIGVELRLFDNNQKGLPAVYNQAIAEAVSQPAILIFIHDDVCLIDYFWPRQVMAGLQHFDMIGVAGNSNRRANQPSWAGFPDSKRMPDDIPEQLSGAVAHGKGFTPDQLNLYGPLCQEVKLLDGLLIAVHSETLHKKSMRFDEIFDFHFYDLDICRLAELKRVRVGTWPIAVIHESNGSFGNASWEAAHVKYLGKWGS